MNEVWKKPPVSFEAYQAMVGKEIGVSSWHLIDQNRINVYADVIEDHQFIHVDPERAKKETAFGNTIAHRFLTMSLMSIMSYEVMPVIEGTIQSATSAGLSSPSISTVTLVRDCNSFGLRSLASASVKRPRTREPARTGDRNRSLSKP